MKRDCRDFRERLALALTGGTVPDAPDVPGGLAALAWHVHLLGCADCRALLEAEEALELLLSTLPDPVLPRDLAERVLARLEPARRERELDELLERDRQAGLEVPAELAAGVLAALRPRRDEAALDRLLDRWPAPAPPAGLAGRVLLGLEPQRARRGPTGVRPRPASWALALVAALFLTFAWAAWMVRGARGRAADPGETGGVTLARSDRGAEQAPAELLASLELLESWELVAADDLDLELAALDEVDLLILELEAEGS